jgi:hypothetical protein
VVVTFREDGRPQHVTCPEVRCPVCDRPITPSDPIRRDGETMLHGNCWTRRARTAAKAVAGGADAAAVIRAKLAAGTRPSAPATKVWAGPGDGAACTGCGEAIRGEVDYEIELAGAVNVHFHRVCYGIWDAERTKLRAIGGGSAASSWTIVFDFPPSADRSDPAALAELLTAGAEGQFSAAERRLLSRELRSLAMSRRRRACELRAAARWIRDRSLEAMLVARDLRHSSPAGASHGQMRRSTSETAPNSAIAISESRIIELKASSVFQ